MNQNVKAEIQDLEKLIDLADTVSLNIQKLEDRRFKTKTEMLLSIVIYVMSVLALILLLTFNGNILAISGLMVILVVITYAFGIYNLYILRARKSIEIELSSEFDVMNRLLEMIHSQKLTVSNNLNVSVLESAILEMRIARIKFSPDYRTST